MSKRGSPGQADGSDDSRSSDFVPNKRQKLITFETLRLLSISGVSDIDAGKLRVQAYKLAETVRHKNKLLEMKDREIERLRQRQTTDENAICLINRHWNNLDEQCRLILLRETSDNQLGEVAQNDSFGDGARDFLNEVAQADGGKAESIYDNRVQTSVHFVKRLMSVIEKKSDQYRSISKKLSRHLDAIPSTSAEDLSIAKENVRLAEENVRLQKEAAKMQEQLSKTRLKLREAEDVNERLTDKNEECLREAAEAKFDLGKAYRTANKFEHKLYETVKEYQSRGSTSSSDPRPNGVSNGNCASSSCANKPDDDIRAELEICKEVMENRLVEIKDLTTKVQNLAEDAARAENKCHITSEMIKTSEEYQNLTAYYSLAIDECQRLRNELDAVTEERDLIRQEHLQKVEDMKREEQQSIRKVMSSSEQNNKGILQFRTEYDMLRMEFEQSLSAQGNSEAKTQDIRVLLNSLKTQNHQLKNEVQKYKKRWNDNVNLVAKLKKDLEAESHRRERCVMIEMDEEDSNELASPDPTRDEADHDERSDDVERLRGLVADLKKRLEVFGNPSLDTRDRAEILIRERRLKAENERLTHHIKRMSIMERKEKERYFENEARKLVAVKEADIERLKHELAEAAKGESILEKEMENIGQALEDVQERIGRLMQESKEKEEQGFKMMSDRITASQIQAKLKEEKMLLDAQVDNLSKQTQAQAIESQAALDSLKIAQETINVKTKENLKLNRHLEALRKLVTEQGLRSEDLTTQNEKLNTQLREAQQVIVSKAGQHEMDVAKNKRLEEDSRVLSKKYERMKKMEKLGSTDAVLMEEIRILKGNLTCPSCKVNQKDAILTKCFHVFCMECLKTRYDTRQRKCPKCNAAFGANDFSRAYIC